MNRHFVTDSLPLKLGAVINNKPKEEVWPKPVTGKPGFFQHKDGKLEYVPDYLEEEASTVPNVDIWDHFTVSNLREQFLKIYKLPTEDAYVINYNDFSNKNYPDLYCSRQDIISGTFRYNNHGLIETSLKNYNITNTTRTQYSGRYDKRKLLEIYKVFISFVFGSSTSTNKMCLTDNNKETLMNSR